MTARILSLALLATGLVAQPTTFNPRQDEIARHFNLGLEYLSAHGYEAAIDSLMSALRLDNSSVRIRYALGLAFYKSGQTHNAIEQWRNILKLGRTDAFLSEKINHVFYSMGRSSRLPNLHGDYVYVRSFFGQGVSPEDRLGLPTGLLVDDTNALYVVDFARHIFWRVGPNGRHYERLLDRSLVSSVSSRDLGLRNPYQALRGDDGLFYLSDFGNDRVVALNEKRRVVSRFGQRAASDDGYLLGPEGMAFDGKGNLFISDTGNSRVHYYNRDAKYVFSFGNEAGLGGAKKLQSPSGLLVDTNEGVLYVCDKGNHRVAVFDLSGRFVRSFGADFLRSPRQVLFAPRASRVLTLLDSEDVYHYDLRSGKHKSVFMAGDDSYRSGQPLSMAYGSNGFLYVGDAASNRVDLYSPVKLLYVNLFVQVERVYLREFPKVLLTVSVQNRDGVRLAGLTTENFEVVELGSKMDISFNGRAEAFNYVRPVVLFEASSEAERRASVARGLARDLYGSFSQEEWSKVYRYGDGFAEASGYNNSVLDKADRTLAGPYYKSVKVGAALKRAIADNLKHNYKKAVVIVCFEPAAKKTFEPESFDVLVDYAAHNGVPVYVLYAGKAGDDFHYERDLTSRTGGSFHQYKGRASVRNMVGRMRTFMDGRYELQYHSSRDDLNKGTFRPVRVSVEYNRLVGEDAMSGYAIP